MAGLSRNIGLMSIAIIIGVILCTLGFNPANEPIDTVAVIWPGTLLHGVGAVLLGGWGIVATVLSAMVVNLLKTGTIHVVVGYTIANIVQAGIPAWYYRRLIKKYGWKSETFRFMPYVIYVVFLSNIVGAMIGALTFYTGSQSFVPFWLPFVRWLIANIPIALFLGWPLFRCLGPVMAEEGLTVSGWWK